MDIAVKDYYAELELTPDADEKAIKQAYRRLARQYHPDVNGGDEATAERFKAVNEAYQILGDSEKRQRYDQMRQQYQYWQQHGGQPGWHGWPGTDDSYVYSYTVSPKDLHDIFGQQSPFGDMFGSVFGGGGQTWPRRGRDIEVLAEITLEEAYRGTRRTLQVGDRRIEARIPVGVQHGSRVRLSGQGHPGLNGGAAGDVLLIVQVAAHPRYERNGDDLTVEVDVDMLTAALGGEVRVATLAHTVRLKVPPRTQSGQRFRLRGKGMPRLEQPEQHGDLYARVRLVLPDNLTADELETLRAMQVARQTR
ncbi:MAG: J domain-containing protein [Chloroflexaceae bacterium]|nr:J domain-containing protein [Chloroflexaceae bacterium]NJO06017.1 J domain-containing protein [Chloroflexaceae bacterium]